MEVVCPHCETQYHLQPDMVGKAMRCPDCKEIFTVTAATPAEAPKEVPYERIEAAPPVVLEAEPVALPKPAVLLPPIPTAVPLGIAPLPTATPLRATPWPAAMRQPAVKEADWRTAAPPLAGETVPAPATAKPALDLPKAKRNPWPLVLTGLILTIFVLGAGTIFKVLYDRSQLESIMETAAKDSFKALNYAEAAKQYDELLAKYPESANAERYRFFAALSALQTSVSSVGLRDDPGAARAKWDAFTKEFGGSPLTKADDQGYGEDVYDAARKLADGYANHAEDKLKKYVSDRSKVEPLTASEQAVAAGQAYVPVAERYRPAEAERLDKVRARFDGLHGEQVRERKRLDVLAPYRDIAADPVEERIAEFTAALMRGGFSDDAEAKGLIAEATAKLRSLLKVVSDYAPPQARTPSGDLPLVTVASPPQRPEPSPANPDLPPETFFAAARGWLYAFDADSGEMLWTTRVGAASPPLRVTLPDGGTEIVVCPSLIDGKAGLTARRSRTGEALWHQLLEAPQAGAMAVVGPRLYVPLGDAAGTFVEFNVNSGDRLARFRLRQRIGAGIARIPDTTLLVVAAEARRLFVIDAAPADANGERLPMRLRHVLLANHPELSLRVPPVFCGAGKPTMILIQNDGTQTTKLRAIALPDMPPLEADAAAPETIVTETSTATLPGQVTFPPAADGERIAVVTDVGAFAVYRTNAPGNLDGGLFSLPATPLPTDARDPLPALAAISSEDSTWVFARGQRTLLQQSFLPATGFKAILRGNPQPAGLPTQPVQHFPLRGVAGAVVRSEGHDSWQASVFDIATGRPVWERTLGAVAVAAPVVLKDGVLLIDDDGGVQKLTPGVKDAAAALRVAPPVVPATGATRVASNAAGDVWVLTPTGKGRVQVRGVKGGQLAFDAGAALPAPFAGAPVMLGEVVVAPLMDGFLHRFDPAAKAFVAGPTWRGTGVAADAICHITTSDAETILATDGAKRIGRWRWPAGGEWAAHGAPIELRDRIALAPLLLTGGERPLLVVAETNGGILLFDPDRPSEPLRRWRPSDDVKPAIPAGKPSHGLQLLPRTNAPPLAVYAVDGRTIVAMAADQTAPAWVIPTDGEYDFLDIMVRDGLLIVTDLAGTVTVYDATGQRLGRQSPKSRDLLPRAAAVPFADRLLLPCVDGTVLFLPGVRKATP